MEEEKSEGVGVERGWEKRKKNNISNYSSQCNYSILGLFICISHHETGFIRSVSVKMPCFSWSDATLKSIVKYKSTTYK